VDHIARLQVQPDLPAGRDMQLIGGDRAARVAVLPPPLSADDRHFQGVRPGGDLFVHLAHHEAEDHDQQSEGDQRPPDL
jgi:hypothetical protein